MNHRSNKLCQTVQCLNLKGTFAFTIQSGRCVYKVLYFSNIFPSAEKHYLIKFSIVYIIWHGYDVVRTMHLVSSVLFTYFSVCNPDITGKFFGHSLYSSGSEIIKFL
jgi:hypothetical protein